MKKRIIVIVICVALLVTGVLIYLCNTKTEWHESLESYGPLNLMEGNANISKNEGDTLFDVYSPKDIKFAYKIFITEGDLQLSFYINGVKCHEETLGVGEHTLETEIFEDVEGQVGYYYEASDDVQGRYSIKIYTREKQWHRYKNRLYERMH